MLKMDKRKAKYHAFIRVGTVLAVFFMQIILIWNMVVYLQMHAANYYLALEMLSVLTVLLLLNDSDENQQTWLVILLVFPGFGFILYYLWGPPRRKSKLHKRIRQREAEMKARLLNDSNVEEEFAKIHPNKVQIARYLERDGFPMYKGTKMKYYPSGEAMEPDFMKDLENAKESIFLEYFIVYDGDWWQRIFRILEAKVEEGVEVRLLVDDFGSLSINNRELRKEIISKGIQICFFAPIDSRISSLSFNYRNHQKIAVIDSTIGYTGGINLADEYINAIVRFDYWKDTAVRLEGAAVWSLTNTFLEMWEESVSGEEPEPERWKPKYHTEDDGYVQPFSGGPHRNPNNPVEGVYLRMINKARDYVYITTPYLVLDNKMMDTLRQAAASGVDVKIMVPHVYDKWYVYMVNVSNYGRLIKSGVKVYEYMPGFIHAKNVISDDECAVCGTVNLDCRSMHIHYENAVFFSENQAVGDMKEDFLDCLEQCEEISYEEWTKRPLWKKMIQSILRLHSPML